MTKAELLASIIADLGANYNSNDESILTEILDETIANALRFSNRQFKTDVEAQYDILASDIRRCTKSLYLQRGAEDVMNQVQNGVNARYVNAAERMRLDIFRGGKRILM